MSLLNTDMHNLRNTLFLLIRVVQRKDDTLHFSQHLCNSVMKYVISSNYFRFLTIACKEFRILSKSRDNNPHNSALHKICVKN